MAPSRSRSRSSRSGSGRPSRSEGATATAANTTAKPGASSAHTLSGLLLLLARLVLLVMAVSTLAALVPFQPWAPGWYLRIAQVLVDYSPALVLALTLALLGRFFNRRSRQSAEPRTLARRLVAIGLVVYAVLVPLQIGGFAWLWFDSASALRGRISSTEARLRPLQDRIRAATSPEALRAALAGNGQPLPPAPPQLPPLPQQKQELLAAIDRDLNQLRTTLSQQRSQQLTGLLVGSLRGVVAAAALAVGLFMIRRSV